MGDEKLHTLIQEKLQPIAKEFVAGLPENGLVKNVRACERLAFHFAIKEMQRLKEKHYTQLIGLSKSMDATFLSLLSEDKESGDFSNVQEFVDFVANANPEELLKEFYGKPNSEESTSITRGHNVHPRIDQALLQHREDEG